MIWIIDNIRAFQAAFTSAGEPDQAVIDAFLQTTQHKQHAPAHEGVKRYYYLLADDPRVVLCCVGMPLADWRGPAMAIVGTREIIGEFPGNRHLVGKKGLQIRMQPATWLKEPADRHFADAGQALEEISFQVLDLETIERSQQDIAQKYRWKK